MKAPAPFDPVLLIEAVANAILRAATGDPAACIADQNEDDRSDFLLAAHAAVGAHDRWLAESGFKIVPPGCLPAPDNEVQAKAMRTIGQRWLQENGGAGKRLIVPARAPLVVN